MFKNLPEELIDKILIFLHKSDLYAILTLGGIFEEAVHRVVSAQLRLLLRQGAVQKHSLQEIGWKEESHDISLCSCIQIYCKYKPFLCGEEKDGPGTLQEDGPGTLQDTLVITPNLFKDKFFMETFTITGNKLFFASFKDKVSLRTLNRDIKAKIENSDLSNSLGSPSLSSQTTQLNERFDERLNERFDERLNERFDERLNERFDERLNERLDESLNKRLNEEKKAGILKATSIHLYSAENTLLLLLTLDDSSNPATMSRFMIYILDTRDSTSLSDPSGFWFNYDRFLPSLPDSIITDVCLKKDTLAIHIFCSSPAYAEEHECQEHSNITLLFNINSTEPPRCDEEIELFFTLKNSAKIDAAYDDTGFIHLNSKYLVIEYLGIQYNSIGLQVYRRKPGSLSTSYSFYSVIDSVMWPYDYESTEDDNILIIEAGCTDRLMCFHKTTLNLHLLNLVNGDILSVLKLSPDVYPSSWFSGYFLLLQMQLHADRITLRVGVYDPDEHLETLIQDSTAELSVTAKELNISDIGRVQLLPSPLTWVDQRGFILLAEQYLIQS